MMDFEAQDMIKFGDFCKIRKKNFLIKFGDFCKKIFDKIW